MCELLVGLDNIAINNVTRDSNGQLTITVTSTNPAPVCKSCGLRLRLKDHNPVRHVDLPVFGQPAALIWNKRRWRRCCEPGSFTEIDPTIAAESHRLTTRAGRWATEQVGRHRRSVSSVANELGCDWHTVNNAVCGWGQALLDADTHRVGDVTCVGLDETLMGRFGPWGTQLWVTSIVDVGGHQLIDLVPGRDSSPIVAALRQRFSRRWLKRVEFVVMDLSGPYRRVFTELFAHAVAVVDRFHVIKNANDRLDEVRRRVQQSELGHRGRRNDPLYGIRRLLVMAEERLDTTGVTKLRDRLALGDPDGEVEAAYAAKEALRDFYRLDEAADAAATIDVLIEIMTARSMPPEVKRLGRMLDRWRTEILNWFTRSVSNGPTEAANNMIKLAKRIGFGFRNFNHYRIRALLYAGKPNWDLLPNINPAQIR